MVASFGGYAEGVHHIDRKLAHGAVPHFNIIDTSETPDEHISEKMHEKAVRH
jgi:hypothetical protein